MQTGIEVINKILEEEIELIKAGGEKYGDIYNLCLKTNTLLCTCFTEYNERYLVFYMIIGTIKKHYLLSILSLVRLHKTESFMNLRIVIEAIYQSIYSIDKVDIGVNELDKVFNNNDKKTFYSFFDENYSELSSFLRDRKNTINKTFAHSGFTHSFLNSKFENDNVNYSFFDRPSIELENTLLHIINDIGTYFLLTIQEKNRYVNILNLTDDFESNLNEIILEKGKILGNS